MTQTMGSRNPNVFSLKINSENVVVRRGRLDCDLLFISCGVAYQHLRLMRVESGTVDRPVRSVVVRKAFGSRDPGAIGVHPFDLAEEIAGEAAVILQKIVPVAAIVAAGAEVSRDPEDLVD